MLNFNFTETDWKLYKKLLPTWQERYIASLNQKYIEILKQEGSHAQNFWTVYEQMTVDKNHPGVMLIRNSRSRMIETISILLKDNIISKNELIDFSDKLKNELLNY